MRLFCILLLLILSGFGLRAQSPAPSGFAQGTLGQLAAQAAQEKKPYLVFVSTDWCSYCKLMKRETFPDPAVREFLAQNFLIQQIDAEKGEGEAFAAQHKIRDYPFILFFGPDGKPLGRIRGFQEAEYFMINLQPIYKKFLKRYPL